MTYIPIKDLKDEVQNSNIYLNQMADVIWQARGIAGDIRTTILSWNINVTWGSLSSVATVTNQAQIWGYLANTQVFDIMNMTATLWNVNNFTI